MAMNESAAANVLTPPLDSEVFDDETTIEQSGRLTGLLRQWNSLVRAEIGSVQSFPYYDQQAQSQQRWHRWLVIVAAITGSTAVLLAILQLGVYARPQLRDTLLDEFLAGSEYVAAGLAALAVVLGLSVAFHTRWQVLRMKTEHYRFVKFQFLLHAAKWANCEADEGDKQLRKLLAGIHALDHRDAHDWAQGVFSLEEDNPAVVVQADDALANDILRYFRHRRLGAQREYFEVQAHRRHIIERRTWLIPPICFFLSILCALLHFVVEIYGHSAIHDPTAHEEERKPVAAKAPENPRPAPPPVEVAAEKPPPGPLMLACLIGAAAFPLIGATVRTIRTAFEFGRNSNRFEGVARSLTRIEKQLDPADTSAAKLHLLRDAEFVLRNENRSWMRLMIEAEWFG